MAKNKNSLNRKPKATALIIFLAVLIIAESIWLVNKLGQFSPEGLPSRSPTSSSEQQKAATIFITAPEQVKQGNSFEATVSITPHKQITTHAVDFVISYDPKKLTLTTMPQLTDRSPLKTLARTLVEPEKERIVVSVIDLQSQMGAVLEKDVNTALFTMSFIGETAGTTNIGFKLTDQSAQTTKVVDADTGNSLPLEVEGESVVVL